MIIQNIELSAFNYFPAISLQFSNLLIKDPLANNDTLLFAKNTFLNFDAFDLINNGGWHFNNLYDIEIIAKKLKTSIPIFI